MQETVELRISEKHGAGILAPTLGKRLSGTTRALVLSTDDPLYQEIGRLHRELRQQDKYLYLGWDIRRRYTKHELECAELFYLHITATVEPPGEECGTIYDESTACRICGAGRRQVSELVLDLRRIPKGRDVARTIADEWIVSQRLAELLVDARMSGFELRPVRHKARYQDDHIDPSRYPSGRELMRRAELAGAPHPTGDFWIWFNRPEQQELRTKLEFEHMEAKERKSARASSPLPLWYQLVVTSQPVPMADPTRFGTEPFDEANEYRCPLGHVSGLNILSEVWVERDRWDGSDIARTEQAVGIREGLLVPSPLLLISPRLWRLLQRERIKGYEVEIARLV